MVLKLRRTARQAGNRNNRNTHRIIVSNYKKYSSVCAIYISHVTAARARPINNKLLAQPYSDQLINIMAVDLYYYVVMSIIVY